jgi:hypothetical protein
VSTQIDRLQALLARIQKRATEPRVMMTMTVAPTALATVPPSADARAAIEKEIKVPTPAPMPAPLPVEPAESRSQLVAARPAAEPEPEVLELDERHIVAEEPAISIEVEEEAPPPSSRRPKPLEEMPEPAVAHPAPPESGRHIAAQELDFEDDRTGVREARREETPTPPPPPNESIPLQPVAAPDAPKRHSMELEIPMHGAPEAPAPAASQVQVVRADVPAAEVAVFEGHAPDFAPKTFGELLDAALAL